LGDELVEHATIPIETGNRDRREAVQNWPFLGVLLQVAPIVGDFPRAQLLHPAIHAFVYLPPDFAEPGPAQPESRQGPLEELDALVAGHHDFNGASDVVGGKQ